jgi:acetyl-CoA C-acetyltransferase
VSEVIMGQVLTGGAGQNPARQASMGAGLPQEVSSMTINQVCGSGLKAVALGCDSILLENNSIVVAGGQESMSNAPHCIPLRNGVTMGDAVVVDTMIKDGLWDVFNDYHMGTTAENIAIRWKLSRASQDEFAYLSQKKAEEALLANRFAGETLPVEVMEKKQRRLLEHDEYPRAGTTMDSLAKLRPAFSKDGSITAGNASGINDGAAAIVLMSEKEANKRALEPLGTVVSWAQCGVDPAIMGTGPIPASKRALEKAGWSVSQLDLIEANEAFAAQALVVCSELGLNKDIVNVNGGSIALGHPIGASGCRVLVTLLYEMQRQNLSKGLVTLCIGGGMGIAMCIERR